MKKTIKALKLPSIFLLIMVSFIACDKDFSIIESDVLGKENSNFETKDTILNIVAYNKKLNSLQINGLASNLLGVFNDPAFGQTTASIITQIAPTSFNPDFGDNPVIDSVVLRIPYFSRITGTENAITTYTIQDSLYGNYDPNTSIKPFKLSIYQNNYFLRDFDPNSTLNEAQNYYSKADGTINNTDNFALNGTSIINFDNNKGPLVKDVDTITPSPSAIRLDRTVDGNVTSEIIAPALRLKLDTLFWKTAIIDKESDAVLSNPNNFKNYFRGLYLKAEALDNGGSMVLLNITSQDANITIYYSKDATVAGERTQSTYTFNFTGNRLNTFINNYDLVTLQDGDENLGDEKLYLKGAEGSMAVVDLFEDQSALDDFINEYRIPDGNGDFLKQAITGDYVLKKLVNEAQLIVYENEIMQTFPKDANGNDYSTFQRIYAYDINNNSPTIDYLIDPTKPTQGQISTLNSNVISLGRRLEDENGNFKYKIRLTEHIKNILLKDSTNTKIGLVLSTNVNYVNNAQILNSEDLVDAIPAAALLTPRGTVLYGTNADKEKKMKLDVFFTEPKGN
tara:strand:+ start:796 stop:2493 length:1698 start_codon:yes stop_codon:yes gene_type:complete